MATPSLDGLLRFAKGLRHPQLFLLILALLGLDLVLPDPIPLMDEAVLGLMALLLGTWKAPGRTASPFAGSDAGPDRPPEKNVTPDPNRPRHT